MSDTGMKLGSITISLHIDETGHEIVHFHEDGDLAMVTRLGMLRMAEDTLLHAPEDDDD